MPEELINILYQLPIVAVFIWYSQIKDKQFQAFLREQREADQKIRAEQLEANRAIMERIASHLASLDKNIEAHDQKTDLAIARMDERTKPIPKRTTTRGSQ